VGLRDGVILCHLINRLQPGAVRKVNDAKINWHKLENIGNFIKAMQEYGMKPHDIFEANDLFENGNMTQVQSSLVSLAGLAKTKGFPTTVDIGVKYAEKQKRQFNDDKLKAGQSVIGLQVKWVIPNCRREKQTLICTGSFCQLHYFGLIDSTHPSKHSQDVSVKQAHLQLGGGDLIHPTNIVLRPEDTGAVENLDVILEPQESQKNHRAEQGRYDVTGVSRYLMKHKLTNKACMLTYRNGAVRFDLGLISYSTKVAGMLAPGTRRDIYDQKGILQPIDNSTISLQMGTNKVASQKGMSVYGLGRQVYDPKYCAAPTEPIIHNGSQGTGTNGSEISDSDYQAEYPEEYTGEYPDDYPRDYHGQYSDQGIDY
ncbi:hypothetical protein AB205_0104130, partial [Aquarana catesbeiana]